MVARSIKYLLAAAVLTVSSCAKNELSDSIQPLHTPGDKSITAFISSDTKTSLDGLKVNWGMDDEIGVFVSSDNYPSAFSLESGAGTSSATFSGYLGGAPFIAKYPFRSDDRYVDGYISTDIPEKQEYVPGSFASGISPMAALFDDEGNASFRNLCSVIRINLTGKVKITELILTTSDEDSYLAGPAKIRIQDGTPVLTIEPLNQTKVTIHTEGDGYPSVRMPCESVQLSQLMQTTFCMVVPSKVYESGLLLEVCTAVGTFTKQTGRLDLKSSTLYDLEPLDVKINGDIEPSPYLQGNGTQSSPYLVSSAEDLLHIQNAMSTGGKITGEDGKAGRVAKSAYYLVNNDIDLSSCCGPQIGSWKPLTVNRNSFTGHFDGGGHKISGLYINASSGDGSFFGDVYSGGYLGNLEVEGEVTAEAATLVCGTNYGTVENCIARGKAVGHNTSNAAGVAKSNTGTIRQCTNYASVSIDGNLYLPAGGISASGMGGVISDCVNYGDVSASTGHCKTGGICGRIQEASVSNCSNYGRIMGKSHAGGIVGDIFQVNVLNCVNYGEVVGSDNSMTLCGGICAQLSDPFSAKEGAISNCVNIGKVSGGLRNAAICPNNVMKTQYCYWLNTISTGVSGGTSKGCSSLSSSQLQGKTAASGLYGGCTNVVDALNSYAFDNATQSQPLQGWMYGSENGWPVHTGRNAIPPGTQDHFIKTSPASFTLNTLAQTVTLSVTSSSELEFSLPDWMSTKDTEHEINGIFHYYICTFSVQQNKSGAVRTASIDVSGQDGTSASVSVTQRYTYISDDYTRNGNVVTVQKASEGNGIDIVLMGDAYTDLDIANGTYESDMKRGIEAFFSVEPYASFRNLFNIYYVETVSASNEIDGTTAFACYFGEGSLVGGKDSKARSYCNSITKKSNLDDVTAIVIINAKRYAGTCYMYSSSNGDHGLGFSVSYFPLGTSSTGQSSMEALIRHEAAGHGFGKLADEYSYQSMGAIPESEVTNFRNRQVYGWWPNVDFTSDPFAVKWTKYIQDDRYAAEQIDVYEGGATYWTGVWRPTQNSIMRYNTGQFNAPSREAIYYKIHRLAYGSTWTYDHEQFVEYDAVNYSVKSVKAAAPTRSEMASFRPTHPPVLVR